MMLENWLRGLANVFGRYALEVENVCGASGACIEKLCPAENPPGCVKPPACPAATLPRCAQAQAASKIPEESARIRRMFHSLLFQMILPFKRTQPASLKSLKWTTHHQLRDLWIQ